MRVSCRDLGGKVQPLFYNNRVVAPRSVAQDTTRPDGPTLLWVRPGQQARQLHAAQQSHWRNPWAFQITAVGGHILQWVSWT